MSKEYRNRYLQKVMTDVAEAVRTGYVLKPGITKFVKSRLQHYGIYTKYLPPDFKLDEDTQVTPEREHEHDHPRVETKAG